MAISIQPKTCPSKKMNIRIKSLGKRWGRNIYRTLLASDGWRYVGKIVVLIFGFTAFMVPVITYQSSTRAAIFDRAHDRLNEFRLKIQNNDSAQRTNGLEELPNVISLRAHKYFNLSLIDSFNTLIGLEGDDEAVLAVHVRLELLAYLASIGKTGLSKNETTALFEMLKKLGREGWINGTPILKAPNDKEAWTWIWNNNTVCNKEIERLRSAFRGIRIQGGNFYNADLCFINLSESKLEKFKFSESSLKHSEFHKTTLDFSEFDKVLMDMSSFKEALFTKCDLRGCSINCSDFQETTFDSCVLLSLDFSNRNNPIRSSTKTTLSRSHFIDCVMSEINFKGAVLTGVSFEVKRGNAIAGATASNFFGADLSNASMINANFEDSDFSYSNLSGAVATGSRLRYCTFNNVILDNADFSEADLTGVKGLCPTDNTNGMAIKSCEGLKIPNVRGLTVNQLKYLLQHGASNNQIN